MSEPKTELPPIPQSDLKRQYAQIRGEVQEAINRVLDSGWFVLGPEVEAFERELAAYCGADFAVAVANGTDALHLALRALGAGPGHEVLVPDNTAFPTAAAVMASGATPVFVDVDPVTSNIDPADLERRITPRTKAVVPVHLFGFPADLDAILRVAAAHDLPVVEDVAQAVGSRYNGSRVGTAGVMGCFSFYPSKNLGAYGDGGLVVTSSEEMAKRLRLLRNYGQTRRYHHESIGFNSRLDELQAAILRVKLGHLDDWISARRRLACRYSGALLGAPVEVPLMPPNGFHTYHLFVIRCRKRDELAAFLAERGITTLIHYPIPLHRQVAFAELPRTAPFPVADRLAGEILSLPLFPELSDGEVDRVAAAIKEFYSSGRAP